MQYHPTIHQILLETKLFNRISNAKGKIKIFRTETSICLTEDFSHWNEVGYHRK